MKTSTIVSTIAVVLALLFAVLYFTKPVPQTQQFGASSGPDQYNAQYFHGGLTVGGNTISTSSSATTALVYPASYFAVGKPAIIVQTASSAAIVTLPASTTLGAFVPSVGDMASFYVCAITSNVSLASSTGVVVVSATGALPVVTASDCSKVSALRKLNTDIQLEMGTYK